MLPVKLTSIKWGISNMQDCKYENDQDGRRWNSNWNKEEKEEVEMNSIWGRTDIRRCINWSERNEVDENREYLEEMNKEIREGSKMRKTRK